MTATLVLPGVLQPFAGGQSSLSTGEPTLRLAIAQLSKAYPDLGPRLCNVNGTPYPFVRFYINGEDVRWHNDLDAALNSGDTITVVAAVAGG